MGGFAFAGAVGATEVFAEVKVSPAEFNGETIVEFEVAGGSELELPGDGAGGSFCAQAIKRTLEKIRKANDSFTYFVITLCY